MIFYNVKEEIARVGENKGKKVFYAAPAPQDKITAKQVEERIVNATALSRADVRSAMTALAEIVREEMFAGRAVDLADIGTIKVVSIGKRVLTEKEVTEKTLKTPRIKFFPKNEMRDQAKRVPRNIIRKDDESKKTEEGKKEAENPTP